MKNKTVEFLIREHGLFLSHFILSKLLDRNPDSFRYTLERSKDPWIKVIKQARRKIGGRLYYSVEMLAPLFSSGDGDTL